MKAKRVLDISQWGKHFANTKASGRMKTYFLHVWIKFVDTIGRGHGHENLFLQSAADISFNIAKTTQTHSSWKWTEFPINL